MTGRIHSVQSLGTVDGPGVRSVVFMQGCPLRCACCHNPDTWDFSGGTETDVRLLISKLLRFRPYFGEKGGVTVSGGEPLMQAEFVAELFRLLHDCAVNTALDTSGCIFNSSVEKLLQHTDLVLLDHKYQDSDKYFRYTRSHLSDTEFFLTQLQQRGIRTWLRRVIIPGLNDDEESVRRLNETANAFSCVEKVELLPFRKLCIEKYKELSVPFPLADTPEPEKETMDRLNMLLDKA